jgi:tetratricopeptide (TPR) repeat protein
VKSTSDPHWLHSSEREDVDAAIAAFEEAGDHAGLALAWRYAGLFEFWSGHCERALAALERADAHRDLAPADDAADVHAIVAWSAFASLLHGPFPSAEADARIVELGARNLRLDAQASALATRARLAAMLGRCDDAHDFIARSKEIFAELGMRAFLTGWSQSYGKAVYLCDGAAAAEAEFRRGYDGLKELGETALLSTLTCYLGAVVYEQGRYDEAFELSEEAERLGAADDVMTQCEWRALRARVLARRGQFEEAERLAEHALAIAKQTDYIDEIGGILSSHGEVLELAGKPDEAERAYAEALTLHEQKGNGVATRAVRERLERLRDVERE